MPSGQGPQRSVSAHSSGAGSAARSVSRRKRRTSTLPSLTTALTRTPPRASNGRPRASSKGACASWRREEGGGKREAGGAALAHVHERSNPCGARRSREAGGVRASGAARGGAQGTAAVRAVSAAVRPDPSLPVRVPPGTPEGILGVRWRVGISSCEGAAWGRG